MKYKAFISYNQKDSGFTQKLHRALIRHATELEPPDNIQIFRDRVCMGVNERIDERLFAYLEEAEWLIVVCSPHVQAADGEKNYVDEECNYFASRLKRKDRIICIIADNAPELRGGILPFCPPCIAGIIEKENLLAADARHDEWDTCVGKVIAGLYGKNFQEYYVHREKLAFEKEYQSFIEQITGFLSKKNYGRAEALLEKYSIPQKYAGFSEFEWNYACSVASRYAFSDYLGAVFVSSRIRKECIAFDTNRKRLYWGDIQGNIYASTFYPDTSPVKFACSSSPVEGIFLLPDGALGILTKKTLETGTLTENAFERTAAYEIKNTFYAMQRSVFNDFYTDGNLLFATDKKKRTVAVLTNASVTAIDLQTGRQTVLSIPDREPWEMKARIAWSYIRVEEKQIILGKEERIVCWYSTGNLLFDYKKKYYLESVYPPEKKNRLLSTNGQWKFRFKDEGFVELVEPVSEKVKAVALKYPRQKVAIEEFVPAGNAVSFLIFHYENGEKCFHFLEKDEEDICFLAKPDDPDTLNLTASVFLKKEKEVYTLWKEKKEIPMESGLNIRFFKSETALFSHHGKRLLTYDPEGNYSGEIPVGIESNGLTALCYDLDFQRHACAYLKKDGEEIELINTELPDTIVSRLTLFRSEEKNLIKKFCEKIKKESFIACTIKFLPDGNLLIGCKNGAVLFWNKTEPAHKIAEHYKEVRNIQVSPGQRYAVSLSDQEIFWYVLPNESPAKKGFYYCPFKIISFLFMKEEQLIGLSENGELAVVELDEKRPPLIFSTGIDSTYDFCLSPDNTITLLVSENAFDEKGCRLTCWSFKKKKVIFCQYFPERIMKFFFTAQNQLVLVFSQKLEVFHIQGGTDFTFQELKEYIVKRRRQEKELVC